MFECVALSLTSAIIWAVVNTIDWSVLHRTQVAPVTYLVLSGIAGIPVVVLAFLVSEFEASYNLPVALALTSGLLLAASTTAYFFALTCMTPSLVAAYLHLSPLLTVLLAWVFFDEALTALGYVGVFILLGAGVLLYIRQNRALSVRPGRGRVLALLSTALLSSAFILQYTALGSLSISAVFVLSQIVFCASSIAPLALAGTRRRMLSCSAMTAMPLLILIFGLECANVAAYFMIIAAQRAGPLVVVAPVTATQPLLVVLFAWVGCRLGLLENSKVRVGTAESVAMLAIILGVFLVTSGF